MKPKRRIPLGSFFAALLLTLCVLGFGGACLLIEYNTRHTLYGETGLPISYRLEQGVPVLTGTDTDTPLLSVPAAIGQAAFSAVSPGKRILFTLWRGETAAAKTLWTFFSSPDAADQ